MFAVGIACGAALGVLLSPTRGALVRSAVRDYASQSSERLQQLASSGMHWAEDTLHQAMGVLEQGRQAFSTSSSGSSSSARSSTSGSSASLTASISDRLSASGRSLDDLSGI
jgi:gas vesicle protein